VFATPRLLADTAGEPEKSLKNISALFSEGACTRIFTLLAGFPTKSLILLEPAVLVEVLTHLHHREVRTER
jgi:hypothetical protein